MRSIEKSVGSQSGFARQVPRAVGSLAGEDRGAEPFVRDAGTLRGDASGRRP